jgi:hypothetical protein
LGLGWLYLIDVIPNNSGITIIWKDRLNYVLHDPNKSSSSSIAIQLGYSTVEKNKHLSYNIIEGSPDMEVKHHDDEYFIIYSSTLVCPAADENDCSDYFFHGGYGDLVKRQKSILTYLPQSDTGFKKGVLPPPKKLLDLGIDREFIPCNFGFTYIFKIDNTQACVKPETAEELIKRGWSEQKIV